MSSPDVVIADIYPGSPGPRGPTGPVGPPGPVGTSTLSGMYNWLAAPPAAGTAGVIVGDSPPAVGEISSLTVSQVDVTGLNCGYFRSEPGTTVLVRDQVAHTLHELKVLGREPVAGETDSIRLHYEVLATDGTSTTGNRVQLMQLAVVEGGTAEAGSALTQQVDQNTADINANAQSIANLNSDLGALHQRVGQLEAEHQQMNTNANWMASRISELDARIAALEAAAG